MFSIHRFLATVALFAVRMLTTAGRVCVSFAFLIIAIAGTNHASAELVLVIERISDTQATLAGSGNIPESASYGSSGEYLDLATVLDLTAAGENPSLSFNTVTLDTTSLVSVFADSPNTIGSGSYPLGIELEFGTISAGSTFTGSATITLDQGTWDEVGSTGSVYWGTNQEVVGSWIITAAVPEPTSFAMFGIVMVGMARRRRLKLQ